MPQIRITTHEERGFTLDFGDMPIRKTLTALASIAHGRANAPKYPTWEEASQAFAAYVQERLPKAARALVVPNPGWEIVVAAGESGFCREMIAEVNSALRSEGLITSAGNYRGGGSSRRVTLDDTAHPDELPPDESPATTKGSAPCWPSTDHHGFGPATVTHPSRPWA